MISLATVKMTGSRVAGRQGRALPPETVRAASSSALTMMGSPASPSAGLTPPALSRKPRAE
eukprot:13745073-Heterocapsa_arctica.AAC.1